MLYNPSTVMTKGQQRNNMKGCTETSQATHSHGHGHAPPLCMAKPRSPAPFNCMFSAIYASAILALMYHHTIILLGSRNLTSLCITLTLFISDFVLAFLFSVELVRLIHSIRRKEFPENLEIVMKRSDFPGLDVFICTADPQKEPPMNVVNTALSVMAYDYPTEKLSVYLSDDGGSSLTLFAFMEAAKFARHWLPFCRKNNVVVRSPNEYFESNYISSSETEKMKMMYESMKVKVEHVVERGRVGEEYITSNDQREALNKWNTHEFTRHDHPTVVQVLLDNGEDKDVVGEFLPNLIYLSRQKSKTSHHHFKAGALNVLLRVSAAMTNGPIILTLDCDMYSNDPQTPLRVLCYYSDPEVRSSYGYIQFPQHFRGINENDIYAGEFKRIFQLIPMGFDGLMGANYLGTNCFFFRRSLFGPPSTMISPEIPELHPDHIVNKPLRSQQVLALAHNVAGCNYENQTPWGYKMGFRYGSVVEDLFTAFQLQCEGWRSLFCSPHRPAFLGDAPINLIGILNQQKRWAYGFLEVTFSKYSPIIFGTRSRGIFFGLAYSGYALWPICSIPITVYAFLPQLALLNRVSIFPKTSEPWFLLYVLLFLATYAQDFRDFVSAGGTFRRWLNDQRIWALRGLSCLLFGSLEFFLKSLGIFRLGFTLTNKAEDDEQRKRYDQGIFEFGVHSSMFVPPVMAALINLTSLVYGLALVLGPGNSEGLVLQILISGFVTLNCWPIYEAIALRKDKGKLPAKTTVVATFLTLALYITTSLVLKKQNGDLA